MTPPARVHLVYQNFSRPQIVGSTATPTLRTPVHSGGSWNSAYPLTNLLRGEQPIESTDATNASTTFDTDFGVAVPLSVTALVGHNLTPYIGSSKVRVRYGQASDFSDNLYDSGWKNACQPFFASGSFPAGWDSGVWTNGPTQAELVNYRGLTYADVADAIHLARYRRVSVDDTGNTMGRFRARDIVSGPAWVPAINMSVGASIGWRPYSGVKTSPWGVRFGRKRRSGRITQFTLSGLDGDQAMEIPFEMDAMVGITDDVLFILDPTTANHLYRWTFLAAQEELTPLDMPEALRRRKTIRLVEKL